MGLDSLNVEDGVATFIQFLSRCSYTDKAEWLTICGFEVKGKLLNRFYSLIT
jgi:hypothetical protein